MEIKAKKLTGITELRAACEATMRGKSNIDFHTAYKSEHSPIRTQIFWVEMIDIPTFVSVHYSRHKVGVEHFVRSNRNDRGGAGDDRVTRETPVNHSMLINAQALIQMARKRLCGKAHRAARGVMLRILEAIYAVDPWLGDFMVPECVYRGGICPEAKPCRDPEILDDFKGYGRMIRGKGENQ